MTAFSGVAARLQKAFTGRAESLVYRAVTLFNAKAPSGAAAAATTITLGSLPAGMDRVKSGDTFGGGTYAFSAEILASGGTIANAAFTPALAAAIAAGAPVQVARNTDTSCKGWVEWLDTSSELAAGVKQMDARVTILADSMALTPKLGDRIVADGRTKVIENVARDPAGAAWLLLVRG